MRRLRAELVLDARAALGECPTWWAEHQALLWVDIARGEVRRFFPDQGRDELLMTAAWASAVAPRAGGGLVVASADGLLIVPPDGRGRRLATGVEFPPVPSRMNDGACDPQGRFWCGTMALHPPRAPGRLYRLDPDAVARPALEGVRMPNGIGWSPDGRLMYFADTETHGLDAFDFDAGGGVLRHRRRVRTFPAGSGLPDGLAVDAEGAIWLALWGAGRVVRLTPDGSIDCVVDVAASQVTSCIFGGPDLTTLYITTAAGGLSPAGLRAEPQAGGIFRVDPGTTGRPPGTYRG